MPSLKERLTAFFGTEEKADEAAELLNLMGTEAKEAGLEYKDTGEEAVDEAQDAKDVDTPDTDEVKDTDALDATDAPDTPDDADTKEVVTREEIADAMEFISKSVIELVLSEAISPLQKEIAELKEQIAQLQASDEEKIADKAAWTSAPSLTDMIRNRAIGKPETQEDGRGSLAKSGPKEASPAVVDSRIPFLGDALDNIISGNFGKDWREQ